ncbi:MAG: alpha/beta hydrolase-fold protein [Pseudomonadota bacterium]
MILRNLAIPFTALLFASTALCAPAASVVETKYIESTVLADNRVGLNLHRSVKVYLPPGYVGGKARYPVIYQLHNINWSNDRSLAPGTAAQPTFDRAIAKGVIQPFIVVAADYTSPAVGPFYANSSTAGRWEDFTLQEVIPFIDSNYRTIAKPGSRGIMGDGMGAFGALHYAFRHPEIFSVVYAMHPVGTGSGLAPMYTRPDWNKVNGARTFADLAGDPYTPIFVAMAQTFLPNPDKPPFYCDMIVDLVDGQPKLNVANLQLLKSRFFLDNTAADNLAKLGKLRGIKFDWGRYDPNQDHVYANQAFTRKLDELGIEHEADEYRGLPWDKYWMDDGRVYTEVLPFFARKLAFQQE